MQKIVAVFVGIVFVLPIAARWVTWPTPEKHEIVPDMVSAGHELFEHEWEPNDPLSPNGDGLGPVFNANSCVACHRQGGPGGAGPNEHNVVTYTIHDVKSGKLKKSGVVHLAAIDASFQEEMTDVEPTLPTTIPQRTRRRLTEDEQRMPTCFSPGFVFPTGVDVSQRNTPALFGAKLIDELSDDVLIAEARRQRLKWAGATDEVEHAPVGKVPRDAKGQVGRFGWKGQTASLADFVQGACANELGLGNPGAAQPMSISLEAKDYKTPGLDLTQMQCDQITQFCLSLPKPIQERAIVVSVRNDQAAGREVFESIGCANCHKPNLGGIEGIYSDLLLHRMGEELVGGGSYNDPPVPLPDFEGEGPHPSEWRTPPLWGVADSAPYMHDGRAATLVEAIEDHGGQADASRTRYTKLDHVQKRQLMAFLQSLKAPKTNESPSNSTSHSVTVGLPTAE